MLYTKACPRCSGDIKLDRDNYGVYAKCLQCGFNRDFVTRRDSTPEMETTGSPFGPEIAAAIESHGDDDQRDAA